MPNVDITPSPRVLRMLGQIDFKPWQCLAELIDNSIDSFLDDRNLGNLFSTPRITVELPNDSDLINGTGEIIVSDNGTGMNLDQLSHAVRAGYSGNDPVEKMGLFGMGFNISTARLGRRTELWTTTYDSAEWIGIVIDFDQLEREISFSAPVKFRQKTEFELETKHHGTEVRIKKLEPDRIRPLIWGAGKANTQKKLGKIYGRVMSSLGVTIIYGGNYIKPWMHCTWNPDRTVPTKNFGNIPARVEINEILDPRNFCSTCWIWLNSNEQYCPSCGSSDHLINRNRCLKGWLGIQRYFDKEHYGIDLIRNGRVIEELDKSLFFYENNQGDKDLEYPIDAIHWGGRIVGELEIDFVRVSHQKDSFDKLDPEWKNVVELVRGVSPLRPQIAERMGLPQNTSPLARLFAGYRTGHVGLSNLVPGDKNGTGINEGLVKEYVEKFYDGESEFQTDEKWYELVLQAENAKRGGTSGSEEAGGPIPLDFGDSTEDNLSDLQNTGENTTPTPNIPQYDIVERIKDNNLSKTYELSIGQVLVTINVQAYIIKNHTQINSYQGKAAYYNFEFEYDPDAPFFEENLDTPLDVLLIDLSQHFLALSAQSPRDYPISKIERCLREKYFPETLMNINIMGNTASAMLNELREHIDFSLPNLAPIDKSIIDDETLDRIQHQVLHIDLGNQDFVNESIVNGTFVKYVDDSFLLTLVKHHPSIILDGSFFSIPYNSLSPILREEATQMAIVGLEDVLWLAGDGRNAISKDLAWRLRFNRAIASLRLLSSWRN